MVDNANVGSAESSQLRLDEPVEPTHARILYRDGRLIVTDLGTADGTFVNGQRIVTATVVRQGQELRIGGWTISHVRSEAAFEARDERERELLDALRLAPSDDALRQVYGDWLEENGKANEAELLSLEREIRDAEERIDDAELGRLGYRLRTVASLTPFRWRAVVSRPRIENCKKGECPRTWEKLTPTTTAFDTRMCSACGELVQLAQTIEGARLEVGQNHAVAVDLGVTRYPRDLEVALARLPPAPVEGPVTSLPLFVTDEPPRTVGALLDSLDIDPDDDLGRYNRMGSYQLPTLDNDPVEGQAPTPVNGHVSSVSINYDWDMHHESPRTRFREIAHKGYRSFDVTFIGDGDLVEDWLRARFGAPRDVVRPHREPSQSGSPYRIYGKYTYVGSARGGGGCMLGWYEKLPDWALPATDKQAALRWLHELATMLGGWFVTYDKIKEFAARPPARCGIVVTGPLNPQDFWLRFEPGLGALEVAHALAIDDPIGTSGDVHMSSWSIVERSSKTRLGYPRYRNWVIELRLGGWPSGEYVPDRYSAKELAAKDLAYSLCIRPYAK